MEYIIAGIRIEMCIRDSLGAFGTARIGLLADAQGLVLDLGAELGGVRAFGVVYDFRGLGVGNPDEFDVQIGIDRNRLEGGQDVYKRQV